MENRKNLCAMIPESLHMQVRDEQEKLMLTLSQYVQQVLEEHFVRGGEKMSNAGSTRTLAFQISEELFDRIKEHLAKHKITQKEFVVGLIERALEEVQASESEAEEKDALPVQDNEQQE